jgi:hypothetical protein
MATAPFFGSWTQWTIGQQSNDVFVLPNPPIFAQFRLVFFCVAPLYGFLTVEWRPIAGMPWAPLLQLPGLPQSVIQVLTLKIAGIPHPLAPVPHALYNININGIFRGVGFVMPWGHKLTVEAAPPHQEKAFWP